MAMPIGKTQIGPGYREHMRDGRSDKVLPSIVPGVDTVKKTGVHPLFEEKMS